MENEDILSQMRPFADILNEVDPSKPKLYLFKTADDKFILGRIDALQPAQDGTGFSFPAGHAVEFTSTDQKITKVNQIFDTNDIQEKWRAVAVQDIKLPIGQPRAENLFRYKDKPDVNAFQLMQYLRTGVDPTSSRPAQPLSAPTSLYPKPMRTVALGGSKKRKTMKSVRKNRRKSRRYSFLS